DRRDEGHEQCPAPVAAVDPGAVLENRDGAGDPDCSGLRWATGAESTGRNGFCHHSVSSAITRSLLPSLDERAAGETEEDVFERRPPDEGALRPHAAPMH